jgi:hypothetical protein
VPWLNLQGGRQPAGDPRLDPDIDPKRAKRILSNRLSAARSKMKAKIMMETMRTKQVGWKCSCEVEGKGRAVTPTLCGHLWSVFVQKPCKVKKQASGRCEPARALLALDVDVAVAGCATSSLTGQVVVSGVVSRHVGCLLGHVVVDVCLSTLLVLHQLLPYPTQPLWCCSVRTPRREHVLVLVAVHVYLVAGQS